MKRFFQRNRFAKKSFLLAVFAIVVLGIIVAGAISRKSGSQETRLGVVTKGDLVQRITVAGTVVPKKRTAILPPYSGYVKKMYVRVGQLVKAGDPLVSVVPSLISEGETFPIRAPFAGTVVQVLHSDGEFVEEKTENNLLVRVDDLSQLFVLADVPEIDMVKIRDGQDVVIKVPAILDRSYKGVIREISMASRERKEWSRNSDKVDFPVRIEVTDKDERIRSGMSTLVDIIPQKRESVLTLKHEYIQKEKDGYFVTLSNGTRKEIKVGLQNEEAFEIVSGLTEGEKVRQVDFLSLPSEN
ncbi:MAG: hypothetical protein A2603_04050 [Bdellovibrionales bacterium RIFOXYD1_FULL_55_31]|nr:MAG: hypothetical protein A2603_04050 [Bdellovibrionales bacterium RIFOXYD1_FULL_55_31]